MTSLPELLPRPYRRPSPAAPGRAPVLRRHVRPMAALAGLLLAGLLAAGCEPAPTPSSAHPPATDRGEHLARTHCAACHAFPDPALLDRPRWTTVLPFMAARLGVYPVHSRDSLIALTAPDGVNVDSLYPTTPALSADEWQALVDYYLREAPDTLTGPPRPPLTVGLPGFRVRDTGQRFRRPLTTLVEIEEERQVFFVGNHARTGSLIVVRGTDEVLFNWLLDGAPIAAQWDEGRLLILLAGQTVAPTDRADGALFVIDGPQEPPRPLLTGLKRPVDLDLADLNGDGRQDFVICEFGNHTGALAWFEDTGDGTYRRHVLNPSPGATNAVVRDLNGDGHPDIGALMAQGDEGIDLYLNDGHGRFSRTRVLRFPPVYGSNHFSFVDANADGIQDILYVNGNNADITPILKPYHGLRLFLGRADGSFEEGFFFPLNGAISAEAADFDGDGDLDIAAISYFPDYARTPEESFVLLRNRGDLTFDAYTFEDAQRGRWLRMAVGDLDGDQDPDILLGSNISFGPQGDRSGLFERWMREAPSVLILENTGPGGE